MFHLIQSQILTQQQINVNLFIKQSKKYKRIEYTHMPVCPPLNRKQRK